MKGHATDSFSPLRKADRVIALGQCFPTFFKLAINDTVDRRKQPLVTRGNQLRVAVMPSS